LNGELLNEKVIHIRFKIEFYRFKSCRSDCFNFPLRPDLFTGFFTASSLRNHWRKISSLRKSQHDFPQWPFLAKIILANEIRHLDASGRGKIPGGIAVAKRRATQVCSGFRRSVA